MRLDHCIYHNSQGFEKLLEWNVQEDGKKKEMEKTVRTTMYTELTFLLVPERVVYLRIGKGLRIEL